MPKGEVQAACDAGSEGWEPLSMSHGAQMGWDTLLLRAARAWLPWCWCCNVAWQHSKEERSLGFRESCGRPLRTHLAQGTPQRLGLAAVLGL